MKNIYFLLSVFIFTISNAQTVDVTPKDSLKYQSIELYRQEFWNKLPKPNRLDK